MADAAQGSGSSGSPELVRAIVEQAPDAIVFADREGRIRMWNRGAERLFGYRPDEVAGANLDVIIPEPLRQAHWAGYDRAMATGRTRHDGRATVTRSMHKDGRKLYVDISFAVIVDEGGTAVGALAIGRDATARHEAERTTRARLAALEAAAAGNPPVPG
jgi:PAS domain S-box-containing protein